jgi:hypothetical protein
VVLAADAVARATPGAAVFTDPAGLLPEAGAAPTADWLPGSAGTVLP